MRAGSVDNVDRVFITLVDKGVDFNHLLMYSSRRNNGAPCSRSGQAMKLGGLESFTLSPILLPTVYRIGSIGLSHDRQGRRPGVIANEINARR